MCDVCVDLIGVLTAREDVGDCRVVRDGDKHVIVVTRKEDSDGSSSEQDEGLGRLGYCIACVDPPNLVVGSSLLCLSCSIASQTEEESDES